MFDQSETYGILEYIDSEWQLKYRTHEKSEIYLSQDSRDF